MTCAPKSYGLFSQYLELSGETIAIILMLAFGRGFKYRMVSAMTNAGNNIIRVYGGQTSVKYQGLSEGRWKNFREDDAHVLLQCIPQTIIGIYV